MKDIAYEMEERPWGKFEVLYDGAECKVKRIEVAPGKRLSYQRHAKRAEKWTVVSGVADVLLDGFPSTMPTGGTVEVPIGTKHRIANNGEEPLIIIEVQIGTYFGEDDIERFEDDYGRA